MRNTVINKKAINKMTNNMEKQIPVLSMNIHSEALRVNALDLYNYLQCEISFKEWIEDLIEGYKGLHEYVVIHEPAVGKRDEPIVVYYINLRLAKTAALRAASPQGEKAYEHLKRSKSSGFLSIIKD
ncbi:MAG: hypothetical protein GY760_28705 [Deltaproteobacteria bacterium]|nr:hypothetical protein [Deltaproteobacteria bacterium]